MKRTRERPRLRSVFSRGLVLVWLAGCAARTPGPGPAEPPVPGVVPPEAAVSLDPRQQLRSQLRKLLDAPGFANAFWGVRIERLNGEVLFDRNGHKGFTPASNMKLYTTAAALDLLGPQFRYETRLEAVGTLTPEGHLDGDLVLVGSGDPSLGSWHLKNGPDSRAVLASWVQQVRAAGIVEISGDILGDGRVFTKQYFSPNWEYGDLPFWYGAGSSGLAIEENAFRFTVTPGPATGDPAAITLNPDTKYITVVNEAKTADPGTTTTVDIVDRNPESNIVRFGGSIAKDRKPLELRGSVWDGACYTAFLLKEALEREGVRVGGSARNISSLPDLGRIDSAPAASRRVLATTTSPPLADLLAIVNKPSHNFFADQILRTLGAKEKGQGSFDAGAEIVQFWLRTIGIPEPDTVKMVDGSGLARRDVVQPRQTCALLRYMYSQDALQRLFYDSLPIAGVDGTISGRMTSAPVKGNVHAKTGFITRARSLSGYVTDADGEVLVFSFMANQFTVPVSEANRLQDAACALLARYSERPPSPPPRPESR